MAFIVLWLICGGIAAMIASSKGGSGVIGFIVGVLLGPIGVIVSFFLGNEKAAAAAQISTGERKKCPRCAELVQPDAMVCKHCNHEFSTVSVNLGG